MEQKRDKITKWSAWETHKANPFRGDMIIVPVKMARKAADPNRVMLVKDTGEERTINFNFHETKENEPFIKIFKESVKMMFGLSTTSMKVFWYITTNVPVNSEVVHVSREECMEFCTFKTPKSYYDGITELLDRELIAKTDKDDYYYINPVVFFNGNRMRITTNFIKTKPNDGFETRSND